MYLRSLELCGFKSFPDTTKLTFTKGITAVVGPNGSGKSNIADAMKWVLGEKSSRSLRGETMEDVIFSGTPYRKKASYAQVTLTIDNADGALKNDSQIVSVSRRLYRNGDSEYQINGSQVRLKDINELFMDTGLGKDGYSIIGQGKISEIVSSKANERRTIFDEAAGITKLSSKKEETERELLKAEDNISRLNDILGELGSRIGPLKKQCEKAKQFKTLDDEKSGLETALWTRRLNALMNTQKESEERLELLKQQYDLLNDKLDKLEDEINEAFANAALWEEKIADKRKEIHAIELESSEAAAKTAVMKNDIEHFYAKTDELEAERKRAENGGERLVNELEAHRAKLEALKSEQVRSIENIEQSEKRLNEISVQEKQLNDIEARTNALINELRLKAAAAEFAIENAKNSIASAESSIEALGAQKAQQLKLKAEQTEKVKEIRTRLEKIESEKTELLNKTSGFERLCAIREKKLNETRGEFSETDLKLKELSQRLNILNDLENAMEGFAYSVKFIIGAASKGRVSGIHGTLSQLITVKNEYSAAIETALGGALQNIVVSDESCAKRAIKLLKDENKGRATFLPITSVKGRELDSRPHNETGYIALASELVGFDEKYSGIIKNLLGRTAVAEDIDSASAIAKKYGYKFRIVTLDGQIINTSGAYTGGSLSKSTGLLTRKNEIAAIKSQSKTLEEKLGTLKNGGEKLAAEVKNLKAQLDGEREKISALDEEKLVKGLELQKCRELLESLDGGEEQIKQRIEELNAQLTEFKQNADEAARLSVETANRENELKAELEKTIQARSDALEKRALEEKALSEQKIAQAELLKDIEAYAQETLRAEQAIKEGENDFERIGAQIDELKEKITLRRQQIADTEQNAAGAADRIKTIEKDIELAQASRFELNADAEKLRAEQKNMMNERETLSNETNRIAERNENLKSEFDKLVGRLWDEYGLTRTEAEENCIDIEDEVQAKRRLEELKTQIKSLGNVNLGAIEEYREVSERYEFMNAQLDDVNASRTELEKLISDLTENMKSIFTESFERISRKFSEIFTELFGGGKGTLSLTDPDDVLGSGVEINVAPPGKVVKNLMSLSGGEKAFAAVCIYFAILTVKPSPFCLLDEIEAALDDVNVARFAAYLHKFTDTTQFITITHRRGTMEEADVLYGVTMQESGVSKLLKMDMDQAKGE